MGIVLVLDVEHLHLLLLLVLAGCEYWLWLGQFQRVVAVLDDDLDDRLRRFDVLRVMVSMLEGLLLLLMGIVALVQVTATVGRVVRVLLGI